MGYSNVTGDLNVYSSTSTRDLSVRQDTTLAGNLTVSGIARFQNIFASNLTVTNAFIITATNTSVTNALSINNAGTSTALKVVQFEGGGSGHTYNVAEFWDFQTLAMVIDPEGNVAIHTTASPGYALTVSQGVLADNVRVTGSYTGSGAGLTSVPVTSLSGALSAPQLQTTQTNVTSLGILLSLNVTGISNLTTTNVQTINVSTGANITQLSVTTLANIASANLITSNILNLNVATGANITQLSVTTLANISSANLVTANIQTLNATTSNTLNLNVSAGANITQLSVTTQANITSANIANLTVPGSFSANAVNTTFFFDTFTIPFIAVTQANVASVLNVATQNVLSLNVSTGANITQLSVTTLANLISANLVTANVQTLNVVSSNISILNVNSGANITYLSVTSQANLVTANIQTLNATTSNTLNLNVATGANITQLSVTTLANISSANLVTANVQTLNVVSSNISILNVNSGANITQLTVTTLANISSANLITSNILNLNVATGANITQLSVTTLANIASANLVTANIQTLNATTSNTLNLNVATGANITQLSVTTLANIASANLITSNIQNLNVSTGANITQLSVTTLANIASANLVTANIRTENVVTSNILSLNVSTGANVTYLTISTQANVVSANLVTANVGTANVITMNLVNLNVTSTANFATANISNIFTTNIVGFVGSQWTGTIPGPLYYNSGNVAIGSSANPGANLTVTGNLFVSNSVTTTNVTATGTITGSWTGTSQGTLLTLGTNTGTGTAFATSTDAPTLQAYHVPLQSFTQNAIQAVSGYTITAQGLIKFSSTGLYQITMALVMDSPVVKVALGTNTSSAFPTSTSAYTYVYTISSAASPSDSITIPINVQNISNYYYLDVFCRSAVTSGTYYLTAGSSITGSQNGTYIQIAPFGNYISSSLNAAAGILVTTTGATLSNPLAQASPLASGSASNTYHVPMTSAAGWTQAGASGIMSVSPNGNFQFNQAGVYQIQVCLNATSQFLMQIGVGTSASDSSLPSTIGPYAYQYAPMYTQDPSTSTTIPLNVTDITKFYYLDATFGPSTTITILPTSTFVAVTPLSSYIPNPMASASVVVSQVVTNQTTSYTATTSDYYIGMSNGGIVTIPQGATLTRGKVYTIKDESGKAGINQAYNIIVQMSGADTIDGQSNAYIQLAWTSVNLMWTGSNNKWSFI